MKSILVTAIGCAIFVAPRIAETQTPPPAEQQRILALIKDVQTQQAQIVDNQAKIESKLVELAEAIRLARLYSARAR